MTNLPAEYARRQQSQQQSQQQAQTAPPPSSFSSLNPAASQQHAKHYDRAWELKRFAKSALLNFLELSGTLSCNASHAQAKVRDLNEIFINMHHLLNEYRPHQARESVIEMMQDHLDRTRTETVAIRTQVDRAKRVLEGLSSLGIVTPEPAQEKGSGIVSGNVSADDDADDDDVEQSQAAQEKLRIEREADMWAGTKALFA